MSHDCKSEAASSASGHSQLCSRPRLSVQLASGPAGPNDEESIADTYVTRATTSPGMKQVAVDSCSPERAFVAFVTLHCLSLLLTHCRALTISDLSQLKSSSYLRKVATNSSRVFLSRVFAESDFVEIRGRPVSSSFPMYITSTVSPTLTF